MQRSPYRKWSEQLWRDALRELHERTNHRLIVHSSGILTFGTLRLGRVF